jgi:transposase
MSNQYTIVPYTNEEINDIITLHQNGMPYSMISRKLKKCAKKIKKILIERGIYVDDKTKGKFKKNQIPHNKKTYTEKEIKNIIELYENGNSIEKMSRLLKIDKKRIKIILIENNAFVEDRDNIRKEFSNEIINNIIEKYSNGLSCQKISKIYNMSITPIKRIIKEKGILRKGYSDGIKIELTEEQRNIIKKLYVTDLKTSSYISEVLNLNKHFIDTYIQKSGYRRTKGESISLRQTGKKRSEKAVLNVKLGQQKLAQSGKRKQTGGVCKRFIINDLMCYGTYEKFYIEKLIKERKKLPQNSKSINTPFGVYYPDFLGDNSLIEIKSDYTYDVLIGKKVNRWSRKIDTTQLEKIKWVNKNIKPVDVLVVDKKNNKIIKKCL